MSCTFLPRKKKSKGIQEKTKIWEQMKHFVHDHTRENSPSMTAHIKNKTVNIENIEKKLFNEIQFILMIYGKLYLSHIITITE